MTRFVSTTALAGLSFLLAVPAAAQFGAPAPQVWTQAPFPMSPGEGVESGDQFGTALASGDFNGDGCDDLAIGTPYEALLGLGFHGVVNIVYGAPTGLAVAQALTGAANGVSRLTAGGSFGYALASGDFDGDGTDDLAVGAPSTPGPAAEGVGAVNVFYGSAAGLGADRAVWLEPSPSSVDVPAQYDGYFGLSLAALDVNGDGFDELAIGHPYLKVAGFSSSGAVHILAGSAGGLTLELDSIDQSRLLGGSPGSGDTFGLTLASGRFNDGPLGDLAIGAPGKTVGAASSAGAVWVLRGTTQGLNRLSYVRLVPHPTHALAAGDRFGASLAAGDIHLDGRDELAVGVPGRSRIVGGRRLFGVGQVDLYYGSASGIVASSVAFLDQSLTGGLEQSDTFGSALALGDTSGDGRADLYAGVPNENGAGAYQRFLTGFSGVSPTGSALVLQPGSGESEAGDRFAAALVLGDFDGNGLLDLATSAPLEDLGPLSNAGRVDVKYHERPLVVGESLGNAPTSPILSRAATRRLRASSSVMSRNTARTRHRR